MRLHYTYGVAHVQFCSWWCNFVASLGLNCESSAQELTTCHLSRHSFIQLDLEKAGASWTPGTYYVDFQNEGDAAMFLLRWS